MQDWHGFGYFCNGHMQRNTMKRWLLLWSCMLGIAGMAVAQEFRFTTQVNSTKVGLDQPFQIQFLLENAPNMRSFVPPSFNDFEVVQGPSQMSGYSNINGKSSEYIAFTYVLKPKAIGNFTIAGATARVNGNLVRSNPVTIEVTRNSGSSANNIGQPAFPHRMPGLHPPLGQQEEETDMAGVLRNGEDPMQKVKKNVFVKVAVDKTSLYEGEQLTATYKLYTRLPTSSKVTKVPAFTGFSAVDLELPNPPQATIEQVNGVPFKVFVIRKTMLFPLQKGTLELDPVEIDNTVRLFKINRTRRSRSHSLLDDFFNDPFGKDPFDDHFFDDFFGGQDVTYQDVSYKLVSSPIKINVKPLPAEGRPASFNGAVGQFALQASLDKTSLSTDDAATLKITVSGAGNINLINAPKVPFPANFETYDTKTTDHFNKNTNPFSGSRTFEYVFMPRTAGNFPIPSVAFSYFDPATHAYKTLQTEKFLLQVSPGKRMDKDEMQDYSAGKELLPINTGVQNWTKQHPSAWGTWWHIVLMLLPLLLLGILAIYRNRLHRMAADIAGTKNRRANKVALKRLRQAAHYLSQQNSKAFYEETSRAIWGYLSDKLNIPYAALSRERVQEQLSNKQVSSEESNALFALISNCELALYAPAGGNGQMKETYEKTLQLIGKLEEQL